MVQKMNANTPILEEIIVKQKEQERAILKQSLFIKELCKQNDRILYILENDTAINSKGLVEQVRNNTANIDKIDSFNTELKVRISITSVILAIASSGVVTFLVNLFFMNKQ